MIELDSTDLIAMNRAHVDPDGTGKLLAWLAKRVDGTVILIGPDGTPDRIVARDGPVPDGDLPVEYGEVAGDIKRVLEGPYGAASASGDGWWVRIMATGRGRAVMVTSRVAFTPVTGALIAQAAALIPVRQAADDRDLAVARTREALLRLLMDQHEDTARSLITGMKPELGELIRICLVDVPASRRKAAAENCETMLGGNAWVIPCPVYVRDLIFLFPAASEGDSADPLIAALRRACPEAAIGAGNIVPLGDTLTGWEQAYHALTAARHSKDKTAEYAAADDLASVLDGPARKWARNLLDPLTRYKPPPNSALTTARLMTTLRSWVDFRDHAYLQMNKAKSTVQWRINLIAGLLGTELVEPPRTGPSHLPEQAEIRLALQLYSGGDEVEDEDGPVPELDEILSQDAARRWAELMRARLAEPTGRHRGADAPGALLEAVRAWVTAPTTARTAHAAAVVGKDPRTVQRWLEVAEQRLGKSITGAPSVRHDLYLAFRILDLAGESLP